MKNKVCRICTALATFLVIAITLTLGFYYAAHDEKLIGDNICPPIDVFESVGMTHVVEMAFAEKDVAYVLGFRTTDIYDLGEMMLAKVNINSQECTLLDTWEGSTSYDLQVNVIDDNTHLVLAGNRLYKTEAGLTSLDNIIENMVTIEHEVHLPSNSVAATSHEPETDGDIYLSKLGDSQRRTLIEAQRDQPGQFYTNLSFSADGQYLLLQDCQGTSLIVNSILCYNVNGELQFEVKSPPMLSDSINMFWIDNSPAMAQSTDRSSKTKTGSYSEVTVWNMDGSVRHMLSLDRELSRTPTIHGGQLSKYFCVSSAEFTQPESIIAIDFVSEKVIAEHEGTYYIHCLAVSDDQSVLCYVEDTTIYLKEIVPS